MAKTSPTSDDKIATVKAWAAREHMDAAQWMFEQRLWDVYSQCESPIEEMFGYALLGLDSYPTDHQTFRQQVPIGKYRVDFLLSFVDPGMAKDGGTDATPAQLVVELDGHDFHERTKEQAKRDKSRDRALIDAGYQVIRFTGSEVYADPVKCAKEASELVGRIYYTRVLGRPLVGG